MYTLVVVVGIVTPTACQSGPQAAADGSYRAFAVAGSGTVPKATMEIQGSSITILEDTGISELTMGTGADGDTVCPPRGKDEPVALDASASVGGVPFTRPAIFGDCGEASPSRVTLIDRDSS